jgi:hypothetical protein
MTTAFGTSNAIIGSNATDRCEEAHHHLRHCSVSTFFYRSLQMIFIACIIQCAENRGSVWL